jgi:hypothetical protein
MKKVLSRVAFAAALGLSLGGCATADSVGNWGSDAWVTSKVKTNIFNEAGLTAGSQVNVETSGGVVQLSGFASSQAEIDKAVAVAQKTSGVKSVRNSVILKR